MRKQLGCTSDGDVYFKGTSYENKRCPRRNIIDNSDVQSVLQMWRISDGKVGVQMLDILSPHAFSALTVIDEGREAKLESDHKERTAMDNAIELARGKK